MKDSSNGGKDQVDGLDSQREGRKAKACVSLRPLWVWAAWGRMADLCEGRFTPLS